MLLGVLAFVVCQLLCALVLVLDGGELVAEKGNREPVGDASDTIWTPNISGGGTLATDPASLARIPFPPKESRQGIAPANP